MRNAPVVIVVTMHVPFGVVAAAFLVVIGVVVMVLCTTRFRRTFEQRWIVVSIAAAVMSLASLVVLVAYFVRSLG